MKQEQISAPPVSGADARRRVVSWANAHWCARAGDADDASLEAIEQTCAHALQQACARGEVAASRAPMIVDDLESIAIARGSLHSWLVQIPIEALCGRAPQALACPVDVGLITPLEAVQASLGERGGFAALNAVYAVRAHLEGLLADHDAGSAVLQPTALARVQDAIIAADACEAARVEAARSLCADIISGKRPSFAAPAGKLMQPLTRAHFTRDVELDIVRGHFLPHRRLGIASEARCAARARCDAIGEVLVAYEPAPATARRAATAAAERRAEALLRRRLEAWVAAGGEMSAAPLKAAWVTGDGAETAGSVAAAERVWRKVVSQDSRFAPLQRRGRRPTEKR